MSEYFVVANSFAAPFFSDTSTGYVSGGTPEQALKAFTEAYKHPAGLYAAVLYASADAYHKNEKALSRWMSNHARFMQDKTGMIRGIFPGRVEIDGIVHDIPDPKNGEIVTANECDS